jgi:hypothetical protein
MSRLVERLSTRLLGAFQSGPKKQTTANLSTVALLPVTADVPLTKFADHLEMALAEYCRKTRCFGYMDP